MQALRTLPILNRPSRPSSPAPPSTQTTNATALAPSVAGTAITHTASEPGKPRSRSLSRQVVDRVSSMHPPAVPASAQVVPNGHALPSQPVTGVKKASPPNSRPATPRTAQTPIPGENGAPQTGYMDVLGLRLNEAVNKASAGVDYKAKKPFKKGSGWNVGESVVKELPYPPNDAYLIRAVLRTAVRSLSIYITRLESLLLPALTDVAFNAPLNLSLPTLHSHPLNPTQYYALSVAHAAWETCEVLEQTLETGKWPRFVNETLRPVMDKLDLVVGKVVQPLLLGLKRDLVASLSRTEGLSPNGSKPIALAHTPATPNVPVTKEGSNAGIARLTKPPSGSGATRQASLPVPIMLQHFASRVDAARKVLEIVAGPCADDGEGWITGVVVAVIWKGMCVVSERDTGATSNRPPSPSSVSKALNGLKLEKEGGAPTPTASLGGVTAKFTTILPSRAASRPPSPSRHSTRWDPMTHALMSLEGLVKRLITGLVEPCLAPTHQDPSVPLEPEHIAREALFEAFEALVSFRLVSTAMHGRNSSTRILASSRRIRDDVDDDDEEALDDAMEDMPSITLFTILLRQANVALGAIPEIMSEKSPYPTAGGPLKLRSPAEIWSWSVVEYERQALQGGFGQAEEWGKRVAMGIKADVERTLLSLGGLVAAGIGSTGEKTGLGKEVVEAQEWVRALGVACEARCGVKVVGAT